MIEKILALTARYKATNSKSERKKKGQFFTSPNTALYMAQEVVRKAEHLSVLDPGCGNMILSAAVIEYAIKNNLCNRFSVTAVENDLEIGKELPTIFSITVVLH